MSYLYKSNSETLLVQVVPLSNTKIFSQNHLIEKGVFNGGKDFKELLPRKLSKGKFPLVAGKPSILILQPTNTYPANSKYNPCNFRGRTDLRF